MGLRISINDKKFGKDEIISIQGIAAVPNGGSVVISDADAELWAQTHGRKLEDAFEDSETVKIAKAADPKPEEEMPSMEELEEEEVKDNA